MAIRDTFKEIQQPAYAPVPEQDSARQREFERIRNGRDLTWDQSRSIMHEIVHGNDEKRKEPSNGRLPSDRSFDF